MTPRRRARTCAAVVAALIVLATRGAAAAPVHNGVPITCRTDAGKERRLPVGYHFSETERDALDKVLKERGDESTRLRAENESLRDSARHDGPGWATVVALVVGFAAGGVATAIVLH